MYLRRSLLYHNIPLCYFTVYKAFFSKLLVHLHKERRRSVLHLKVRWRSEKSEFSRTSVGDSQNQAPGLQLTSFLTTGPISFLLSSAHVPVPNHTVTHGAGTWHLMLNKGTYETTKQTVTGPEETASLEKNLLPQQCHFRHKHCFPCHPSYFQRIYHLWTFTKCLALRIIKDAMSRSLSPKLWAFIWGLKFIQMLTWLNWA